MQKIINQPKTALELWKEETQLPSILTFSKNIDGILNDGVKLGAVTEIIGLPGVGKTQLCLQLCASVQIPQCLGGLDGEAVFISTNTNFTIERFIDILKGSMMKCESLLSGVFSFNLEDSLKKIHFYETVGCLEFLAVLRKIPMLLKTRQNIRLIVIDSITFPFLTGVTEKRRTGILFESVGFLQKLADEMRLALVLTNEMSNRVGLSSTSVGALGDAWAHRSNTRILLTNFDGIRHAAVLKSNELPERTAQFQITKEGVRDPG